jgi:hypothetical protein
MALGRNNSRERTRIRNLVLWAGLLSVAVLILALIRVVDLSGLAQKTDSPADRGSRPAQSVTQEAERGTATGGNTGASGNAARWGSGAAGSGTGTPTGSSTNVTGSNPNTSGAGTGIGTGSATSGSDPSQSGGPAGASSR